MECLGFAKRVFTFRNYRHCCSNVPVPRFKFKVPCFQTARLQVKVERSNTVLTVNARCILESSQVSAKDENNVDQRIEVKVHSRESNQMTFFPFEDKPQSQQNLIAKTEIQRSVTETLQRPFGCVCVGSAISKRMQNPTDLHDTRNSLKAYLCMSKFAIIWKPLGENPKNPNFTNNLMLWDIGNSKEKDH